MKRNMILLLFMFMKLTSCVEYHPRQDFKLQVDILSGSKSYEVYSSSMFIETVFHREVALCIENHFNPNASVQFWDAIKNEYTKPLKLDQEVTVVRRNMITDWSIVISEGLNVTVTIENSTVYGSLVFKKCRKELFTTLDHNITSSFRPLQSWDHTIHVPFDLTRFYNVTKYVDFSTILPKRVLSSNNWQLKGFCMNATLGGNIKIHMSRCKSAEPFTVQLNATKDRQIIRYWSDFISLDEKCSIKEETLPDHLWMEFEAIEHIGIGEVVIYNCHHTWNRGDNGEEVIRIVPVLEKLESTVWSFDYIVLPFRQNVHFAPIKHMLDTALITGADVQISLILQIPHMISFSSCYTSEKYEFKMNPAQKVMNLTRNDLKVLSDFSNVLNCPEDKTHHGVYIKIGADDEKVTGTVLFQLIGTKGVETPEGKLQNDVQSTVAFNLLKGYWISRNVNLQRLIYQGAGNIHVELNQMFNSTGLVQLYISRCELSPKLKLFGPMKVGSASFDRKTVDYIFGFFNQTSCLTDFQDRRYEYRNKDKYGLYFHVEALENSIGYTTTYETFKAKLIYHELNEEYAETLPPNRMFNSFRVFKPSEVVADLQIGSLLERVLLKPAASLRLYVFCSAPLEFAFSQCRDTIKKDWHKLGSNPNESVAAWYTFDSEGVDLLRAYSDSPNCEDKAQPRLFIHVRTEQRMSVKFEFSVVNGTDLNVVHKCLTSESLTLQEKELHVKFLIVLVEIASVIVIILGVASVCFILRKMQRKNEAIEKETMVLENMFTGQSYLHDEYI